MGNVRVSLRGGPEDGQETDVPADASGVPIPRFTVPARPTRETRLAQRPPLLVYERESQRPDGTWRFHYVGAVAQD